LDATVGRFRQGAVRRLGVGAPIEERNVTAELGFASSLSRYAIIFARCQHVDTTTTTSSGLELFTRRRPWRAAPRQRRQAGACALPL